MIRRRLALGGEVQGVGLRPALSRLARAHGLTGRVTNQAEDVIVELQGPPEAVAAAQHALAALPLPLRIDRMHSEALPPQPAERAFEIGASPAGQGASAGLLPPDLAPCEPCREELADPKNRRYRYPFIACCQCGPRASIALTAPFDRERCAQAPFPRCAACEAEFSDPADRRFHAQLTACADCGPRLRFGDQQGEAALDAALLALQSGAVLALKGVGGFQLICDAQRPEAVDRVRVLKARPHKPLALLVADLAGAEALAAVDRQAAALLTGPGAPIVLLPPRADSGLAAGVAPGAQELGLMLPASPLHLLLAQGMGGPLLCTSANRSGQGMALLATELGPLAADGVLDHDRAVLRALDDGLLRPSQRGPMVLRRARGSLPRSLSAPTDGPTVLGWGAQLKLAPALCVGGRAHLGAPAESIDDLSAEARFLAEVEGLWSIAAPAALACDLHPDLPSTRLAEARAAAAGLPLIRVQHHEAHARAVIGEHGSEGPLLALTWDGYGLGLHGEAWGGEALWLAGPTCQRVASLRPLPLPGGDAAAREPERVGRALLQQLGLAAPPGVQTGRDAPGIAALLALAARPSCPQTSSMGRLFDGVGWLCGGPATLSYEGQGAQALEALAARATGPAPTWALPLVPDATGLLRVDWGPLVAGLREARARGADPASLALGFHRSLVALAAALADHHQAGTVALAGGCFQNRRLLEEISSALEAGGHRVLVARDLPPNDGGLAYGQCLAARQRLHSEG